METDCPLRILIVEDLPADAELAERELRKGGILFTSKRVDTKEGFLNALEEFRPDLILSDYMMPQFDGMQALNLSLVHDPHLPFIIFTGSMKEETALACMKAGATDYIIKEHMTRLPLAVLGAIEQQKVRLEKEKTAEELMAIYENAPLIMMLIDGERRLHKVNGYAAAFSGRSVDAMHLMRYGEALRCLNALASPEGCGFGEQCEQCLIHRSVTETLETGRSHHLVEGSLSYRSDQQEGKMIYFLSTTKLTLKKQSLVLVSLLDITNRKQAEEELRASEERFKAIFNRGPLGIALIDSMTGCICMANPMFAKIAHRTMEETIHIDWMSITHPDDVRETLDNIALLNAGKIDQFRKQIRYLCPDDSVVWLNMTVAPLRVEDKLYPLHLCMIEDITERKQAEDELKESKILIEAVVENIPLMIFLKEAMDLRFVIFNRAGEELLGHDRKDLLGKNNLDLFPPEQAAHFMSKDREVLDGNVGMLDIPEEPIQTARKGQRLLHTRKVCIRGSDGTTKYLLGISEDITEHKQAEEALRHTNETLGTIIRSSPLAIIVLDPDGNVKKWNPAAEQMFGWLESEVLGQFLPIVYEDKRDENLKLRERVLGGEAFNNVEVRRRKKDGSPIDISISTAPLRDSQGRVTGILSVSADITDRKRAEEALESERTLLRSLIDSVPDRIYAKDSEGRFIICNEAMIRRMGMTSMAELVGKSDFDFLPPEMAQRFRADEQAVIQSGIPMINREEPLVTESGTITRWNLATKVPLLDRQGNLIGIVGVGREITDRKEAEKQLQDTLESLRKAIGVTIQVMGSVMETRDPYTAGHQTRSADLARAIATEMGLPHDKIDGIRMAGSIHDIGKLSIPAEILSKPTELSKNEFALIKEHACQGYKILKHVESCWPLAEIVYQHHERMDGSGYPRHLKGDDILMEARILAVADVVEAMASHRPYRPALGMNAALEEIEMNRGTFYDEAVADACLRLFREKGFQLEGI